MSECYIVIGRDGSDEDALARRMKAREAHLKAGEEAKQKGNLLYAAALCDDTGEKMNGSVMVVQFDSRAELDTWLKSEPYVVQGVWKEIEIKRAKIAPFFQKMS